MSAGGSRGRFGLCDGYIACPVVDPPGATDAFDLYAADD